MTSGLGDTHMKRKRTAAEKRARRERKQKYMTIFLNGNKSEFRAPS